MKLSDRFYSPLTWLRHRRARKVNGAYLTAVCAEIDSRRAIANLERAIAGTGAEVVVLVLPEQAIAA